MSRPVDLAAPPADDDDLIRVLGSIERDGKLPPWVSKRDLYTDVPEVVTAACQAVPGGDGRPVFYVLTGLRSMGGHDLHVSRTAGLGYWRIDKTHAIWPTAGEAGSSSSGGAPLGTSSALAFFLRAPGGAETRNGWLMKELVLRHRRGQAAGYALCKIYKKKLSRKAAVAAAAAAGRQPPLLPPLRSGCAPCSAATASPPSGCAPCSAATASPPSGCAPASAATASPPPSGSTPSSSRKWLLLELEGSSSPPKTGHRLTIKRVFNLLQLDEEDIEEGEIEETLGDRKKRAKAASENAALILAPDDILHLKTVVA